jgi:hypothetical protein
MPELGDMLAKLPPKEREAILNGPAYIPLPEGVKPDFTHSNNQNGLAFGVLTAGLVVTSLFVVLRAWAKVICVKRVHIEDGTVHPFCPSISPECFSVANQPTFRINTCRFCMFYP